MLMTLSQHCVIITNKLGVTNMPSILYAIGLTSGSILSAYFGWTDDAPMLKNIALMVSGYCMGGLMLLVLENMDN